MTVVGDSLHLPSIGRVWCCSLPSCTQEPGRQARFLSPFIPPRSPTQSEKQAARAPRLEATAGHTRPPAPEPSLLLSVLLFWLFMLRPKSMNKVTTQRLHEQSGERATGESVLDLVAWNSGGAGGRLSDVSDGGAVLTASLELRWRRRRSRGHTVRAFPPVKRFEGRARRTARWRCGRCPSDS